MSMREVKICDREDWTLLLPEHRAARPEWSFWEYPRLLSMHANLKPGDMLVDVGAEEGDLSALFATWGCDLFLAEPNPRVWPNIKAIFEANDLWDPHYMFVGFVGAELRDRIGYYRRPVWPESAYGPIIGDHGFLNLCERPDVAVTTIDHMETHVDIDAITIDIEGAELLALRGAARTLESVKPLVWVSIHPDFSRDMYGTTRQDVLDFMGAHGYRYEHLAAEHEHHVFFWHPEKHEPVLPYGHT